MKYVVGSAIVLVYILFAFFIGRKIRSKQYKHLTLLIVCLGLFLRIFICGDLFLHDWDEQFHALVAKSILAHPLKPTLYSADFLHAPPELWTQSYVWLSKPPLPFWMVGLSLKILGNNEIGLRLPSVIFSVLSIFLTLQIGTLLFGSRVGFIAGFFHAIHGLSIELAGGIVSSDHVEVQFLFFFELGIFLILQQYKRSQKQLSIWIGVIIGLCFLCKWIMAFFLLFIWVGVVVFTKKKKGKILQEFALIAIPFCAIALSWIAYIFQHYPIEAKWILSEVFTPISKPIQGHSGDMFYYFIQMGILFGEFIYIPFLLLLFYVFKKKSGGSILILVWIAIPMILLSFSQTKRDTYLMMTAPAFFILIGYTLTILWIKIRTNPKQKISYLIFALVLICLPIRYSLERVKPFRQKLIEPTWKTNLRQFEKEKQGQKIIIINEPHAHQVMFYTSFLAYDFTPSQKQLDVAKAAGYELVENNKGVYLDFK